MFLLGILAFLQITIIPGVLILKASDFRGTVLQWMTYAFALSLVASYILVFSLTVIHLYNQVTLLIVLVGEMLGLAWLYKQEIQSPVFEILQDKIEKIKTEFNAFVGLDAEHKPSNSLNILLTAILIALAFTGVVWTVRLFINNFGSVFDAWDAVVSWNRWALTWASGQIPSDNRLYPQLIPINWSLTYVLIGNTTIQAFAKGIMPLFAVFILLSLFDLGMETKSIGFFIGGILAQLLIKKFLVSEITNGYVDVAVAFFGFLAIHALIMAGKTMNTSRSDQYLLLGVVFAAGATVTKQPGIYIFALYPILSYINVLRHNNSGLKKNLKKYLAPFLFVSLIPISWYVFKQFHSIRNIETFNIPDYFDITANAYGNISISEQIVTAISQFDKYLILFVIIVAGFLLLKPFYRALTILIVLPYPIIWAWVAGYDTRNLAVFIPILALTAGVAIQELYKFSIKLLRRTTFFGLKLYSLLITLFITILVGILTIPSGRLVEQQVQLQKQIFSPSKNEKIYSIIEENPDTKILTNYPIRFLPGLENNQIHSGFKDINLFITWTENPEVGYIFIPNKAIDEIKNYIDEKVDNGDYELVFVDKEWINYKMIRIINR